MASDTSMAADTSMIDDENDDVSVSAMSDSEDESALPTMWSSHIISKADLQKELVHSCLLSLPKHLTGMRIQPLCRLNKGCCVNITAGTPNQPRRQR